MDPSAFSFGDNHKSRSTTTLIDFSCSHAAHFRRLQSRLHEAYHILPDSNSSETSNSKQVESSASEKIWGAPEVSLKECNMCGDVGISEDLFRCNRCRQRYQHIYCSRSYPILGSEIWVCNWCLNDEDKMHEEKRLKKLKLKKRKAEDLADERRNNAFECLLQIAQSERVPEAKLIGCATFSKEITSKTQVPNRQECYSSAEKDKLVALNHRHLTAPRAGGRRYKRLADVVC